MHVCGAVLAGGGSVRMGRPKHALVLGDGRTMLEHVVDALREMCGDVVALGRVDAAGGLRCLEDHRPGAGPLAGIESLLEAASESSKERVKHQQFIICPCDVPLVTGALLSQLLVEMDSLATVFRVDGRKRFESLPMRVSADALDILRHYLDAGKRSVQGLVKAVGYAEIVIDENTAQQLQNINTPEEFASLRLGDAFNSDV